jgi:hypothetical protein
MISFTQIDRIKEGEVDRAYSTHCEEGEWIYSYYRRTSIDDVKGKTET